MKKVMLTTVVSSIVIFGCSKEKLIEKEDCPTYNTADTQLIEHMPLEIGNYWVYQSYRINSLGTEIPQGPLDSIYVDRDTIINGHTYFILQGNGVAKLFIGEIIRNTNNSIVSYSGENQPDKTIFSTNKLGTTLCKDTADYTPNYYWVSTLSVNPNTEFKTVDAGKYLCFKRKEVTDITVPSIETRTQYQFFNQDIGVLAFQYRFLAAGTLQENRLVRFNVN